MDICFNLSGYISKIVIVGSYGNSTFHFSRNFQIVFQRTAPFYTPEMRDGSSVSTSSPILVVICPFTLAILVDMLSFYR